MPKDAPTTPTEPNPLLAAIAMLKCRHQYLNGTDMSQVTLEGMQSLMEGVMGFDISPFLNQKYAPVLLSIFRHLKVPDDEMGYLKDLHALCPDGGHMHGEHENETQDSSKGTRGTRSRVVVNEEWVGIPVKAWCGFWERGMAYVNVGKGEFQRKKRQGIVIFCESGSDKKWTAYCQGEQLYFEDRPVGPDMNPSTQEETGIAPSPSSAPSKAPKQRKRKTPQSGCIEASDPMLLEIQSRHTWLWEAQLGEVHRLAAELKSKAHDLKVSVQSEPQKKQKSSQKSVGARPASLLFKTENGEPFHFSKDYSLRCLHRRHLVTGRIKFTSSKLSWKAMKICPMYPTERCACMDGKGWSHYASLSPRSVLKVIELMREMDDPRNPGEKMWKKEWEY